MAQTMMSGRWADPEPMDTVGGGQGARRVPSSDAFNVLSDSEETKARRQSLKNTHSSATRRRSRNALRDKSKAAAAATVPPTTPVPDSQWIHRDKLAEIEIKEMEAAGIDVTPYRRSISAGPNGRTSRSQSRTARRPSEGAAGHTSAISTDDYPSVDPRIPPIPSAPSEDDPDNDPFDPTTDTEFRTLAELAAEHRPPRTNTLVRPSTSRIPLSKASPVPVPATVVDRDSPLPRSRTNSNAWSPNGPTWDDTLYARRARSNSIGSAALLDDDRPESPHQHDSSGSNASPRKSTGPKHPPSSRKPLTKTTSKEQRDRPPSRGHVSRPSTARAPEGEAPWIASMYKPDPRLPPDQQMLPTHAKRMQQEQWEAEGKTGTAYDRDLRLLNDTQQPQAPQQNGTLKPLPSPPIPSPRAPETQQNGVAGDSAWPLSPKSEGQQSPGASSRPGTSGGYRITPTIASPPVLPSPVKPMSMTAPHNATPRLEEKEEEGSGKEKRGGCGCCVVM